MNTIKQVQNQRYHIYNQDPTMVNPISKLFMYPYRCTQKKYNKNSPFDSICTWNYTQIHWFFRFNIHKFRSDFIVRTVNRSIKGSRAQRQGNLNRRYSSCSTNLNRFGQRLALLVIVRRREGEAPRHRSLRRLSGPNTSDRSRRIGAREKRSRL